MTYNLSKHGKKSQNSPPKHTDEHFVETTQAGSDKEKKTELLTGYIFSEAKGELFGFTGMKKGENLKIRKILMPLKGEDAILQWCSYLIQMDEERNNPSKFKELWDDTKDLDTDKGTRSGQSFNFTNWKQAEKEQSEKEQSETASEEDYSFKRIADVGSELKTHIDGEDLILECRFQIPGGKYQLQEGGLTNYLANAIDSLTNNAAERFIEMLLSKVEKAKAKSSSAPILI